MEPAIQLSTRKAQTLRSLLDHLATGKHEQGDLWPEGPITRIAYKCLARG